MSSPTQKPIPLFPIPEPVTGIWRDARAIERAAYLVAAVLFASGLFHFAVFLTGDTAWAGPVSWRKPTTFGLSFGLTLATLTWVSAQLTTGTRLRTILTGVFIATSVAETGGITLQAWRGVPSHFNYDDGFSSAVTAVLAFGGVVIVAAVLALTIAAYRRPATDAAMRLATRAGLTILMGAMASGAAMIATGVILSNAGNEQAAYDTAGWLKPTHAVTMHAVGVLPALAWLLAAAKVGERRRLTITRLAVWAYVAAAAGTAAVNLVIGR
ncbi:hypothetical protein [Actinorhabdospora filicis]|nr:hypothetical protein [Actinorhabdospora filicis]